MMAESDPLQTPGAHENGDVTLGPSCNKIIQDYLLEHDETFRHLREIREQVRCLEPTAAYRC